MTFGQQLQYLRKQKGYSQEQLAQQLCVAEPLYRDRHQHHKGICQRSGIGAFRLSITFTVLKNGGACAPPFLRYTNLFSSAL